MREGQRLLEALRGALQTRRRRATIDFVDGGARQGCDLFGERQSFARETEKADEAIHAAPPVAPMRIPLRVVLGCQLGEFALGTRE